MAVALYAFYGNFVCVRAANRLVLQAEVPRCPGIWWRIYPGHSRTSGPRRQTWQPCPGLDPNRYVHRCSRLLEDALMPDHESEGPGSMGLWHRPYCSSGEGPPDDVEADAEADLECQIAGCYSPVHSDWSGPACSTGSESCAGVAATHASGVDGVGIQTPPVCRSPMLGRLPQH